MVKSDRQKGGTRIRQPRHNWLFWWLRWKKIFRKKIVWLWPWEFHIRCFYFLVYLYGMAAVSRRNHNCRKRMPNSKIKFDVDQYFQLPLTLLTSIILEALGYGSHVIKIEFWPWLPYPGTTIILYEMKFRSIFGSEAIWYKYRLRWLCDRSTRDGCDWLRVSRRRLRGNRETFLNSKMNTKHQILENLFEIFKNI